MRSALLTSRQTPVLQSTVISLFHISSPIIAMDKHSDRSAANGSRNRGRGNRRSPNAASALSVTDPDADVEGLIESTQKLTFALPMSPLSNRSAGTSSLAQSKHLSTKTPSLPLSPPEKSTKPLPLSPHATAATAPTPTEASTPAKTRRMPIIFSPSFAKHRPPPGRRHPECPQRLEVTVDALKSHPTLSPLLDWQHPKTVSLADDPTHRDTVLEAVRAVHRFPNYLDLLRETCARGGGGIDKDTYVAPESFDVALLAAGAWMEAVDIALGGSAPRAAWALTRPPGHHAVPATGMGFCLLSNAAIAAKYALEQRDVSSVAILDFDVHHGNGTEASIKNDERIRFASSHQWPLYPGSGPEGTTGKFDNVLNINLESGTGIDRYRARFEDEMLPFLLEPEGRPKPELVIVSAGFDALDVDPLAQLDFKPSDYRLFTQLLMERVGEDVGVVFGLEGGYNLGENGLSAAVVECISGYCFPKSEE